MNFIDKMIFCLYRYYKKDLFQAKMVFSIYIFLFFIPILFFIDKILGLGIFNPTNKPNYFTTLIYIAIPLLIIVQVLTVKGYEIEEITDEEGKILRKNGKKYLIIFLLTTLIMWAIRIFLVIQ